MKWCKICPILDKGGLEGEGGRRIWLGADSFDDSFAAFDALKFAIVGIYFYNTNALQHCQTLETRARSRSGQSCQKFDDHDELCVWSWPSEQSSNGLKI